MKPTPPRRFPPSALRGRHLVSSPGAEDRGMVTAEIAVALPALMLVMLLCLWGVVAGAMKLRVEDAARMSARALARGDSEAKARAVVASTVHHSTNISISRGVETVTVKVSAEVPTFPALKRLMPHLSVTGTSRALQEHR